MTTLDDHDQDASLVTSLPPMAGGLLELPAIRVLIVHEDSTFRAHASRAVQQALSGASLPARIRSLGSGAMALANARERKPDLVLLDWGLGGQVGSADVLTALRERYGAGRVRVVIIAGRTTREDEQRMAAFSVRDVLTRPVEFGVLVGTVQKLAAQERWLT